MSETTLTRRQAAVLATTGLVAAATGMTASDTADAARQANMEAALGSLVAARDSLARATPNKGGHRRRAIQLVEEAISETRKGIRFAANY